ncbi:hypothetical protein ACLOJK_008061 [Asimina triloba]
MSIINSVVESAIGKLGEGLILAFFREAIFLRGVGLQVQMLKDELRAMQSFLEDADAKQLVDRRVKNWVNDVRAVACEAGDAIDVFAYDIAPLRRRPGFLGKLKRYAFILTELKALHDLGKKIRGINAKITEISRRRETYDIQSIAPRGEETGSSETHSLRRHSSPHVPEPDFVGLDEQFNSLIRHLTERERRRCAVSLVGMGGLGKTTLARKAYNHEAVVNRFSCRAWVSVSQQYSVRELLLTIGKQCCVWSIEELQRMTAAELSSKIFDSLKNRTYFLVLDDIWEPRAWDDLKDAFPDESNGSRILLTTRTREVALYADVRSRPHELPFLKEDESWQLFCKKAFPGQEIGCPRDLESIGREIVKKCRGLPLAIVVMGGLLLTKMQEASEWRKILDSIHWQFMEGDKRVFEILSLSYNDLPYSMKPCFLYLAVLPEDYKFPANRLIQLWAAEGLLPQRGHETPEEVGEDILMELISRNLIQVAETSSSGLIKSCCTHDLLRDLCVLKAKEEKFLEVHQWSSASPSACEGRRLALHGMDARTFTCFKSPTLHHLQSIFLFNENQKDELGRRQQRLLFKNFKMLRVLDLDQVLIREVPDEIGKLVHLRYLHCSNTSIESLPQSMANLGNLQTLDVVRKHVNGVLHIPKPVEQMLQGLRHLRLVTYVHSSEYHDVESSELCPDDCWQNMKPYLSSKFLDIISPSTSTIRYEERLELENSHKSSKVSELNLIHECSNITASSSTSSPMPMPPPLQRPLLTSCHLKLSGYLSKLPDQPCDFPSKLSKIKLSYSNLMKDPLPLLEKLENLRFLILDIDSYVGKEMACSAGGFPKLQSLHLRELYNLEGWTVGAGAMPCLSDLQITSCYQLQMLPEGLKYSMKLQTLVIRHLPSTFTKRIQPRVGEDWNKIQRIPSIKIVLKLLHWYMLVKASYLFSDVLFLV